MIARRTRAGSTTGYSARLLPRGLIVVALAALLLTGSAAFAYAAPSAPGNVLASATNSSTIAVTWDAPSDVGVGIDYYEIYIDGSLGATTTLTSYDAMGFGPATTHSFEITAVDANGASPKSLAATAMTLGNPLPITTAMVTPAPVGGWYTSTPSVTLLSDRPGVTYYSLVTSSGPWNVYVAPVDIPDGDSTICFYSADSDGNAGAVSSLQLLVDTIAPSITVSGVFNGAIYNTPVAPTFSAVDANLGIVTATLDGQIFTSGSTVATDGAHTLVVTASDVAGNTSWTTTNFTVDTTPPSISLLGVSDGALYNAAVTPVFSASDDNLLSLVATLDGQPFTSGTTVSAEGTHTLVVTAGDLAGNSSSSTSAFAIDTTPPSVTASVSPASPDGLDGWYKTTPQTTLSASEPATISYSLISSDGPYTGYTAPLASADGTSTLYYRAVDPAGNQSAAASLTVSVDTTPPPVPDSVTATSTGYTSAQVSWNGVSDGTSGLAYYSVYQGGSLVATTTSLGYAASSLTTGTIHFFSVVAVDVAGNLSAQSAVASATTTADTTPPTTTFVLAPASPDGANGWFVSVPSVTLLADEPGITYYSLVASSGPWTAYPGPLVMPEATSTLYYYSVDGAGNAETVTSRTINVDLTPPSTPAATATAVSTTTISVGWQPATDAGSGVAEYRVLDAASSAVVATASGTATEAPVPNLSPDTTYGFKVVAVDAAGLVSGQSAAVEARTFPPDKTAPITNAVLTPATSDGENGWYLTVPKIELSMNESGTILWNWDSDAPQPYTGPFDGLLGDHQLSYHGVDLAGNAEEVTTRHILVDDKAPSTPTSLDATVSGPTTVLLDWKASTDNQSGVGGYRIYGNSGSVIATAASDSTTYTVTVPTGKLQSFFVRAFDIAGNVSGRSNTRNLSIPRGTSTSGTAGPSTVNENSPAFGRSSFTYSDLRDQTPKYQGGYAQFDNTATAQYTSNPHGGYGTASNKCQVCHAVHRAEGAYYLMRAASEPDACIYCHVGSSHSGMQVYSSDPSGMHAAVGHAIGFSGPIPASSVSVSLKTVTVKSTDVDGKTATSTITIRSTGTENRLFRMSRRHSQNEAGDLQYGYSRIGPTSLTCISCHQVHNAQSEIWQPSAFPNNDTRRTEGYKLLRASPSGSIWGPDDMAYDGTRTVSYTRDGMIGFKAYTDFSTTGLVNKENVIRAVETTITTSNTGEGKTIWQSSKWPSQPTSDPSNATASVNQFALSVWCADCHNLAIGSSADRAKGAIGTVQFAQTPTISDSTEVTSSATDWTQAKQVTVDLTDVQMLRVVTNLTSTGAGSADLALSLGSANATITHTVDTGTNQFTDDINVAGRSGVDTLTLSLKATGTGVASNTQFDVYSGTETTSAVKVVADLSKPAHEASMTHSVPFRGAENGPAQCYTCHRGDLSPKPDRPYYNQQKADCELCHYGTGSYATDPLRSGAGQSDFPHSAAANGAYMLGAWTVDDKRSVVATTVGESPEDIKEKVCTRCHIDGKLTHSVVPK